MTTPSSTRDNLIKARALIDTPEKASMLTIDGALHAAADSDVARVDARWALCRQLPKSFRRLLINMERRGTHRQIMALFDRAISSQENQS